MLGQDGLERVIGELYNHVSFFGAFLVELDKSAYFTRRGTSSVLTTKKGLRGRKGEVETSSGSGNVSGMCGGKEKREASGLNASERESVVKERGCLVARI